MNNIWSHRDISFRKVQRKWQVDGTKQTLLASLETISRKLLWRKAYSRLSNNGHITTVHREELRERAHQFYSLRSESVVGIENSFEEPFVAELQGGYILSETGLGITEDGACIVESANTPGSETNVMACLSRQLFSGDPQIVLDLLQRDIDSLQTRARSIETAVPLIARHPNYYHWLIETVPKIRYVRQFESATGREATYLVPSDRPSWVEETLKFLDIPDSKIERITAPVYHAQPLLIPSFPRYSEIDYQWLQKHILSQNGAKADNSNVYISRSNAISRRVVNEDEVMDLLSEYGFQRYHLENRSLEENATLFRNADIVVGAHGAGLTDIVFCTNTSVVELFGARIKKPYQQIAAEIGLVYRELYCEPVSTDIYVDTAELESVIKELVD